jgi:hypothetical protein
VLLRCRDDRSPYYGGIMKSNSLTANRISNQLCDTMPHHASERDFWASV